MGKASKNLSRFKMIKALALWALSHTVTAEESSILLGASVSSLDIDYSHS